ncbi:VWA domain-containing protein [Pseudahrensia aquimaris]|uniref:VWA domain-containing protein n=1 Tax=Pseudahrensia aquimaris TaxID=744461 RepID=A0ABW3FJX0_9HYPH
MARTPEDIPSSKEHSLAPASGKKGGGSVSLKSDINQFLSAASKLKGRAGERGGLIFALDATMSREATWDEAMRVQAQMFDSVKSVGSLDVQLVYFRGYGECRASRWVGDTDSLRDLMTGISCRGGQTQIGKLLSHARKEMQRKDGTRARAMVFVGDAMEEDVDALCAKAGELGVLGLPVFMFQEGRDGLTERAFKEIARLSGGAHMHFGPGAAAKLSELLKAVARYAAGGRAALANPETATERLLLEQLK